MCYSHIISFTLSCNRRLIHPLRFNTSWSFLKLALCLPLPRYPTPTAFPSETPTRIRPATGLVTLMNHVWPHRSRNRTLSAVFVGEFPCSLRNAFAAYKLPACLSCGSLNGKGNPHSTHCQAIPCLRLTAIKSGLPFRTVGVLADVWINLYRVAPSRLLIWHQTVKRSRQATVLKLSPSCYSLFKRDHKTSPRAPVNGPRYRSVSTCATVNQ